MSTTQSPTYCVELDGAQNLRTIQVAYDRLLAALAEHQTIEIQCNGIAELDISLIQLLLAAKRSADESGKSLRLAAPAAGKLRVALDRAGFLAAGIGEPNPTTAFWLQGSNAQ